MTERCVGDERTRVGDERSREALLHINIRSKAFNLLKGTHEYENAAA